MSATWREDEVEGSDWAVRGGLLVEVTPEIEG